MADKIARLISFLLHPLWMPLLVMLLLFSPAGPVPFRMSQPFILALSGIVVLTTLLSPLLVTWILIRLGLVSSLFMNNREERIYPVITVAVFYSLTLYLLPKLEILAIFNQYMKGAAILAVVSLFISMFDKISLHMIGLGGLAGLFLGLSLRFGNGMHAALLGSILLAGLAGWARLRSGAHTPGQIYTGFLTGLPVMAGVILFLL